MFEFFGGARINLLLTLITHRHRLAALPYFAVYGGLIVLTSAVVVPRPQVLDPWLSPSKARAYLDVGESTLDKYVAAGLIRYERLPSGDRRFRVSDLDALFTVAVPAAAGA